MGNLLQIVKGYKSFGPKILFEEATFSIEEGEHVGVIGPNGAGKSTLFKILIGEDRLDSGEFIQKRGLRIGYLSQHDSWKPGQTVEEYLSEGTRLPIWDLKSLGRSLGLTQVEFAAEIQSLSGGYRTRAKLLYLLGCEPDILLLDEPTNYLDLESTLALEGFLQETRSAFLLISHDREFLRRTTEHILEVEAGDIVKFSGGLDEYFEQKQILRSQLEATALSQAQKKAQILEFVTRFGAKASKARQAQSRLKQLNKMESIDLKPLPVSARIRIPDPRHCGKTVVSSNEASLGYGEKIVLKNVNFSIERGDHIAVVGVNGAGKSTLLKALAGRLQPQSGQVQLGYEVKIGYYAQHVGEALDPRLSVIESLQAAAEDGVSVQEVKNLAGSLLFSGDDAKKKVSVLSGGEKARVALGQILLERNPFLILDEPTNHLDFQTVEALTEALNSYSGTVVVVSHDRSFVRRVGRKILEVNNGRVSVYPGSYEEYVWSQQQKAKVTQEITNQKKDVEIPKVPDQNLQSPQKNSSSREREKRLKKLEQDLGKLEEQITKVQGDLEGLVREKNGDSSTWAMSRELSAKLQELLSQKAVLEEEWLLLGVTS